MINNSFNNNNNSNINVTLPPHTVPKVLTKQLGLANDSDFVGRKEELQKVDELLNQNSMLLLLNGIGGIGKSTLASYYLNHNKDNYDYYGFVQVNEDIKLSFASAFSTSLDLKSEKLDDLFVEIMNKLHNLEGKKLLIIDDVKKMDNQLDEMNTLMTLKNSGFKILFTSRETKEYIPQYRLDIMNQEDARKLFTKHFPTDEIDKVDKILVYLDYHTLFIEITAKTLAKRKNTLSLDIAIEKFEKGEFTAIKINKSESFNKFLKNFSYDSTILTQKKTLLFLKRLSVLPSIEISFDELYKFLVCEDKEQLEDFLIELIDNGWLIESQQHYKLHQILKEFVFDNYTPTFDETKKVVEYFTACIDNSADVQTAIDVQEDLGYFGGVAISMEKLGIKNKTVGVLDDELGNIYRHLGEYSKALLWLEKAININEKVLGLEHPLTATSHNNIGLVYQAKGEYDKALEYHKKALAIYEKVLDLEHPSIAISYNNIAAVYQVKGEYDKALEYYKKASVIKKKVLGLEHPLTATSYNNVGEIYRIKGEYDKALEYFKKSLAISEKALELEHPNIAISYNNIGLVYDSKREYDKALEYHKKSLAIREKVLGLEHPSVAISYNNIGAIYRAKEEYDKALKYFKKASVIFENVLGLEHPNTISSYNNIGEIYRAKEEYDKALEYHKKASVIKEKVLGLEHPSVAISYNNIAVLFYNIKNYQEAVKYMQEAVDIWQKVLPANHQNLIISKKNLEIFKAKL
jgi:tetratricopeptide (TPR) repeat protein